MLSVSAPNEIPNFKFVLNGKEFPICKFQFCRYSLRFQKDSSLFNSDSYSINSQVSETSLLSFINACQGKPFSITTENVLDMKLLCNEFEVPSILTTIKKYFDEHENELLLQRLEFSIQHNEDYSDLIGKIASHIDDYINVEKMYDLPENILCQIYSDKSRKTTNEHQLYDFAKKYAQKKSETTSSLLTYIDYSALSRNEIRELSESSLMPDKISTSYIFPFLLKMIAQAEEQENKIKEFQERSQQAENQFNGKVSTINQTLNEIKEETNSAKDSLDAIQNSYQKIGQSIDEMEHKIESQSSLDQAQSISTALTEKMNKIEKRTRSVWAQQNPLKGIFYNWKKDHQQKNPALNNFVQIITPKQPEERFKAANLLEYEQPLLDACYYLNQNLTNEDQNEQNWIDFDFGESNKISPYAFAIRTNSLGETISHPRDFELLGSNDRNNWESIAKIENAESLNGTRIAKTFVCENNESSKSYRYLRYLQRDSHYMYNDRFGIISLSAIEFFGDIASI